MDLKADEQKLLDIWNRHCYAEFAERNVDGALETMTEDASVVTLPVLLGGDGKDGVRTFYGEYFLAQLPPDMQATVISRTIGQNRIVEESVFQFTHSVQMDWFLPGILPTHRVVEIAVVAVIWFRDGKIAGEHLYWDQASVLAQVGLLDGSALPVMGAESARRLLDPSVPLNALLARD
jgi:carboxymethylenebutenolidase